MFLCIPWKHQILLKRKYLSSDLFVSHVNFSPTRSSLEFLQSVQKVVQQKESLVSAQAWLCSDAYRNAHLHNQFNIANTARARSSALHENSTESPDLEFTSQQNAGSVSHQPLQLPEDSSVHVQGFLHSWECELLKITLDKTCSQTPFTCQLKDWVRNLWKRCSFRSQSAEYAGQ